MLPEYYYILPEEAEYINAEVRAWEDTRPASRDFMPKYHDEGADIIRLAVMEYIANSRGLTFDIEKGIIRE